MLKSAAIPMAAPAASRTLTVHEIISLVRTYVVAMLVCPTHDSVDAAVGDDTLNANVLPMIGVELLVNLSVIWNDAVITVGAVMKNENVEPPFTLESATLPLPEGPYTGTEKSVLNPVVAPLDVITFTVHEISSDIRTNVVDPLLCPTQLNTDDVDGVPRTANEKLLPTRLVPPAVSFSVIANTDAITVGAVTTKLNVRPPLPGARVADPEPEGP